MCRTDGRTGGWAWKPRRIWSESSRTGVDMVGSRPKQADVDGLVSDGQMESGRSWWVGGRICVRRTDGRIGCDINKKIDKTEQEVALGPAGGWDVWPIDGGGRWQPWVGGDDPKQARACAKIEISMNFDEKLFKVSEIGWDEGAQGSDR